jgi:hypothetical protein
LHNPNNFNALVINPTNKIKMGSSPHYYAGSGQTVNVPCVDINDGAIQVEVNSDRIINMINYLERISNSKNLLLFVNGYRDNAPNPSELPDEADMVNTSDIYNYWGQVGAQFINRIGTQNVIYADGHSSVATSNHNSEAAFLANLSQWQCASGLIASIYTTLLNPMLGTSCAAYYHNADLFKLNTTPNTAGFNTRKSEGMQAGLDLVKKINNGTVSFNRATDTLDIVSHSMGYAYALGMIQILKTGTIPLGRFYCVAPENACSGDINLNDFKEVWQYGTNEALDLVWEQDGVAPQCPIKNIGTPLPHTLNGRIYLPQDFYPKTFLGCHSINNYGWIFNLEQKTDGYVKARK